MYRCGKPATTNKVRKFKLKASTLFGAMSTQRQNANGKANKGKGAIQRPPATLNIAWRAKGKMN